MQYQLQGIEGLYQKSRQQMEGTAPSPPPPTETPGNQLPTMEAGIQLLQGSATHVLPAAILFLGRTLEIAAGIGVTGNWSERAWKNALGGAAAVQLFLLAYAEMCGARETARLPSSKSAEALVRGEPGSLQTVFLHWLGRSAIIGIGIAAAGERHKVVAQALAGGAAIEVAVLLWALQQKQDASAVVQETISG